MKLHAEEVSSLGFYLWNTLMRLERVMLLEHYAAGSSAGTNVNFLHSNIH